MSRKTSWVVITLCVVAAVMFAVPVWAEEYGSPQSTADNGAELRPSGNQGNGNHNGGNGNGQNLDVDTMHVKTLEVDEVRVNNLVILSGGSMTQAQARAHIRQRAQVGRRTTGPAVDQAARASASAAAASAKKAQGAADAAMTEARAAKKSADSANAAIGDWKAEEGTLAAAVRALKMYQAETADAVGGWDTEGKGSIADNIGDWDKATNGTIAYAMDQLDGAGRALAKEVNRVASRASMGMGLSIAALLFLFVFVIVLKKVIEKRHDTTMEGLEAIHNRVLVLEAAAGPTPPAPDGGGPTAPIMLDPTT